MPIPKLAEFLNRSNKHSQMREMFTQLIEKIESQEESLEKSKDVERNIQVKINAVVENAESIIDNYAYLILDEENQIGLALHKDGSLEVAGAMHQSADKVSKLVFAIVDEEGNIGFSVNDDGSINHGNINLSEGMVSATVDENDNVASVMHANGVTHYSELHSRLLVADQILTNTISCYESAGDIYAVIGGATIQITHDGLNKSPTSVGANIIFLSNKQGTYKQYIYKNGEITRYHPNDAFLKFKHVVLTGQSLAWGPDTIVDGKMVTGQLCLGAERVFSYYESLGDPQPLQDKVNETIATGFASALLAHVTRKFYLAAVLEAVEPTRSLRKMAQKIFTKMYLKISFVRKVNMILGLMYLRFCSFMGKLMEPWEHRIMTFV